METIPHINTDWEYRADSGKLGEWQVTPEGYLVANAKIARIGIQEYQNSDGTLRREFRPPEEVANLDSLKTLCDLPISIEHPPVMLDSSNVRQFMVGWNGAVTYDGGFVSTKVKLTDREAVKSALDGGRIELSVGYVTKLDWTPGMWQGQKYDAVQRNIRGNHIALTVKARGGSDLRLYPEGSRKDSEILEKCWLISDRDWPESEVRLDNLHIKVGGDRNMKMYDKDNLAEMSKDDLISLFLEHQTVMTEEMEELIDKKDSQIAFLQGKVAAAEDSLSVQSSLDDRTDNANAVNRRVKEKEIRIAELESRIDSAESANTSLRRQLDEVKSRAQKLDSDLTAIRAAQEQEITTQRESWVETWNKALPFLPRISKEEPDYTLDSVGIMRLALQNSRPSLNLDSLVQSASNPDDVIKTAFSVMVAEGLPKAPVQKNFMGQLIDQAKTDSGGYFSSSLEKTREEKKKNAQEAWKAKK